MRLVLVVCLAAIVGLTLIRRSASRAHAGVIGFWGSVVIVGSVLRVGKHAASLTDFLIFGARSRDFEEFLFLDLPLVLGYAFVLGAVIAVPWLSRSSIKEVGSQLRQDLSIAEWRRFFTRRLVWLVGVVVVLLWRWLAGYSP